MDKILNILIVTRGQEDRHLQSVIDRLRGKHGVATIRANEIKLPWWYKILHQIEEYDFYYRRMKGQINYYKERAFNSYPAWLQKIVRYIPNLGWLKRFYKPPRAVYNQLKEMKPDLVIATSLMLLPEYEDFQYAVAAKDLKIPLIGFAPTWDSLTTKTFINPIPDILFLWNDSHEEQAIKYHKIPKEIIRKVGAYTHEQFLTSRLPIRKDKFFKKYGFNEKEGFLLYTYSSPNIFGDEAIFIEKLAKDTGRQILAQVHPNSPKETYLKETEKIKFSLTDSYSNYLYCGEVWGVNTSAFLEAGLMGKKINAIGFPGLSLEAHQSLHFKSLLPVVEGKQTMKEWLNAGDKLPSELTVEIIKNYLNLI